MLHRWHEVITEQNSEFDPTMRPFRHGPKLVAGRSHRKQSTITRKWLVLPVSTAILYILW